MLVTFKLATAGAAVKLKQDGKPDTVLAFGGEKVEKKLDTTVKWTLTASLKDYSDFEQVIVFEDGKGTATVEIKLDKNDAATAAVPVAPTVAGASAPPPTVGPAAADFGTINANSFGAELRAEEHQDTFIGAEPSKLSVAQRVEGLAPRDNPALLALAEQPCEPSLNRGSQLGIFGNGVLFGVVANRRLAVARSQQPRCSTQRLPTDVAVGTELGRPLQVAQPLFAPDRNEVGVVVHVAGGCRVGHELPKV